jgi:hypothetical protein
MEKAKPEFVLVSQSPLPPPQASSSSTGPPIAPSLIHPLIHYHYADDPPLSLLPPVSGAQVLVMDFDPSSSNPPRVQSLSEDVVVTGVQVTEAATEGREGTNSNMYLVETLVPVQQRSISPPFSSVVHSESTHFTHLGSMRMSHYRKDETSLDSPLIDNSNSTMACFTQRLVVLGHVSVGQVLNNLAADRNQLLRRVLEFPHSSPSADATKAVSAGDQQH